MMIYDHIYQTYGLSKTQQEILNIVGKEKVVLEIGPSTGYMTKLFLENGCILDIVEKDKKVFPKLPKGIRKMINLSIEDVKILSLLFGDYDFIILADVLEHLIDPENTLKDLKKISSSKTKLIISLPNVANWVMRKQLFFKGDFEYQESGLLDTTHLHFYTVDTLPKLLAKCGWRVKQIIGTLTRLPFEESINKIPVVNLLFKKIIYKKLAEKYKNLSYYHFITIASK